MLAVIYRVRSNWFFISRIHLWGSFFFRSSLVWAYKSLFLQFRAEKGASLVFSECDKSTELMYIFSWTQKAIPVEPQCRRVKHWASEDYVIREMFLCQQLHWCVNWHHILWSFRNQVRALEKKKSQTNLTLKSNCWQTIGTIEHSWNSAG